MSGWALAIIAAIGAMIAYFQWVTAHQRIALELFDRRFEVVLSLRRAVLTALAHGDYGEKQQREFGDAVLRARFLFGPEVFSLLEQTISDLDIVDFGERHPKHISKPEKERDFADAKGRLRDFVPESFKLFDPYMRAPFKMGSFWHPFGGR